MYKRMIYLVKIREILQFLKIGELLKDTVIFYCRDLIVTQFSAR